MKWVIIRREKNGNENVVMSKNTLGEINKIWQNYIDFARKNGWFISKVNPLDEFSDEFIENPDNGIIYSLEIR